MKIAQVVESFCYGTAKSVKQLCDILKDEHEVTVYYAHRDGTDVDEADLAPDINWVKLPGSGPIGHLRNLLFLYRHIGRDTQLMHGHSSIGGAYVKFLSPFLPARVLYSPRGYAFLRSDYSKVFRALFRTFEQVTSPLCETVACGPSEMEIAQKIARKTHEIGNGWTIDHDVDSDAIGNGKIMGVGRISIQKGFDIFLQIARQLPDVPFTWIGSAETGQEHLAADIPPNVEVKPYLPHDELLAQLVASRFILLPSRWEGLSRFLIESACAGKAIVTSRCASNVDCLVPPADGNQYANGFSCDTTEDYVAAITELVQNDDLVRKMQRASLQHARETFDIELIKKKWHRLYAGKDINGATKDLPAPASIA